MTCATILFTDIVGYSKQSQTDQKGMVELLTRCTREEVAGLTSAWAPAVVMLPTGDGLAVAFLDGAGDGPQRMRRALHLAARLLHEIKDAGGELRLGIHAGEVGRIDDVNNQRNIFGAAINMAQRVMDAANANQCLVSDAAWDPCIGGAMATGTKFDLLPHGPAKALVHDTLHTVMVKHDRHAIVRVVDLEWQGARLTSVEAPRSKDQAVLEFTRLPKDRESFVEAMRGARQVALVQLTGRALLSLVRPDELRADLTHLWVFMPSAEALQGITGQVPISGIAKQAATIQAWEDLLNGVRTRLTTANVHLGILDAVPGFGASMLDWDGPEGRLHISPYVWGTHPSHTPGYDIHWTNGLRPPVAAPYVKMIHMMRDGMGPA